MQFITHFPLDAILGRNVCHFRNALKFEGNSSTFNSLIEKFEGYDIFGL